MSHAFAFMRYASVLLAFVIAAPLWAQQPPSTAPVTGHDKGHQEHRRDKGAKSDTMPTGAAAKEQARARNERVWNDATRLAALLRDVQVEVTITPAMWRTIANEANTLANRIYGRTAGNAEARRLARDLRMHVREMRKAALNGDATGARRHATEALPFAFRLIDWAA